jgi:hypothetical protein
LFLVEVKLKECTKNKNGQKQMNFQCKPVCSETPFPLGFLREPVLGEQDKLHNKPNSF